MTINYPIKKETTKNTIIKNNKMTHGMLFESELNSSNEYYRNNGIAIIYKKPTPVQIVKVDYPSRSKARIVEGYYKTPSTTDYNGIYKGKYIDYEAKETNNLSFDFQHIFEHQVMHLLNIDKMGGIGFVIIYFKTVDEIYIMDIKDFYALWKDGKNGGRKSIKIDTFKELGKLVKRGYAPTVDYLVAVDEMYFNDENI